MFSAKTLCERPNPSVRNRMVGYFFNRLKYRDFGLFPDALTAIAAWNPAESQVDPYVTTGLAPGDGRSASWAIWVHG
jgi:hypothetical protein